MIKTELPLPEHFHSEKAGEVWRVDYEDIAASAWDWAKTRNIAPAAKDRFRLGLFLVDVQNTFCIPGFELFVGGRSGNAAVEDSRRLSEFIYRNLARIHRVILTLDTHHAMQIFHSLFFVNEAGEHPGPYAQITAEDIAEGRWRFNEALSPYLGRSPENVQDHLQYYTETLKARGKFTHTVWPYHAMLGSIGHALVALIEEAIFFHSITRYSQPDFQVKGRHPLTENYSALSAEVATDHAGKVLVPENTALLNSLYTYDALIFAGQAKSHCVAWTISDLLNSLTDKDPALAKKIYLLEDCTSPVVIPGVIDFTDAADEAFRHFQAAGMHIVQSTTPLALWPGVIGETLAAETVR